MGDVRFAYSGTAMVDCRDCQISSCSLRCRICAPKCVVLATMESLIITSMCMQDFFLSGIVSPLAAELAAVARNIDGVGCSFIFHSLLSVHATLIIVR